MATSKDNRSAQQIALRKPETLDNLLAMEQRVAAACGKPAMSWFARKTTPGHYRSETCPETGKKFPNAMDVKAWALGEAPTDMVPMFEEDDTEDAYACSSQYGLCE